jgi:CRP/FNR family cyclic AMP-dependent transcriptional regulator
MATANNNPRQSIAYRGFAANGSCAQVNSHLPMTSTTRQQRFDPQAFLAEAGQGRSLAEYQKNDKVFSQGERADAIFYIQKGRVKFTVLSPQGKEAVVSILGGGDFFGEECLSGEGELTRMATAVAMSECSIMRLTRKEMDRVLHEEPAFAELFRQHLIQRNIRTQEDLVDQLFNFSEKRLARVLLLLANSGKDGTREPVIPEISQETLAEMVGTTRSRVSVFMTRFRKRGFIQYKDGIQVHSSLVNFIQQ